MINFYQYSFLWNSCIYCLWCYSLQWNHHKSDVFLCMCKGKQGEVLKASMSMPGKNEHWPRMTTENTWHFTIGISVYILFCTWVSSPQDIFFLLWEVMTTPEIGAHLLGVPGKRKEEQTQLFSPDWEVKHQTNICEILYFVLISN